MKKLLLASLLSFSLVGCQTMNEMKEDINDGVTEMKDDINDVKDPTYKYGLNLNELWMVPSFCNATIGTTLFRGY